MTIFLNLKFWQGKPKVLDAWGERVGVRGEFIIFLFLGEPRVHDLLGGEGDKEFLQDFFGTVETAATGRPRTIFRIAAREPAALSKPYNPWWHRCPHLCLVGPEAVPNLIEYFHWSNYGAQSAPSMM
jgi:hypothetical protein